MAKNILIGKITSAHGVKGAVNIISYCEKPADIGKYKQIHNNKGRDFQIKLISKAKGKNRDIFIAEISGVKTRNEAELLNKTELFINRDQLADLADNEFYYADLVGLEAWDMDGKKIGKIIAVNDFGAGGMVEVEFDGENKREIFPFTNAVIPEVNLKKGYLKIDFPEIIEIQDE